MLDQIKPGSRIQVRVVKTPLRIAAAKTLVRILSKDADTKAENKRLAQVRRKNLHFKQRGGRPWGNRLVKQRPVKGQIGESGTITATVDVLADLASVEPFIEVSAAN